MLRRSEHFNDWSWSA